MSLRFRSEADRGRIRAVVDLPSRRVPRQMLLRFRHPDGKPVQRVEVNGRAWERFDVAREWVDLTSLEGRLEVTAYY
ncbi:MAG: hypothetical protein M5U12_29555 [Verrucomicrobia bacterium]|nr:hypothetical protein [Verrucomicrobiota bacterium]